jgi:hypothetical protein
VYSNESQYPLREENDTKTQMYSGCMRGTTSPTFVGEKIIRFQEVWASIAKSTHEHCQVSSRSDSRGTGYIIRVSDHVIAMEEAAGQFSAATWIRDDKENWNLRVGLGDTERLAALLDSFVSGSTPAPWIEQE